MEMLTFITSLGFCVIRFDNIMKRNCIKVELIRNVNIICFDNDPDGYIDNISDYQLQKQRGREIKNNSTNTTKEITFIHHI